MTTTTHPVVDRYAAAINEGDLAAVSALFSDDASLVHPVGTFTDRDRISDFYRDVVLSLRRRHKDRDGEGDDDDGGPTTTRGEHRDP